MKNNEKAPKEQGKQPMKYWLVEITSTDSEDLQFYVSAINQFEAYKKAEDYALLAENEVLRNTYRGFKLLP
jgi:hypothetical protein